MELKQKSLITVFSVFLAFPVFSSEKIYVSSEKDHRLVIFDAETLEKVGFVETGERPRAIAFNPAQTRIYAATGDSDVIEVIDLATAEVVDELEVGEDPEMFDVSVDGKYLYASLEEDAQLSIFNLEDKSVDVVDVGEEPEGVLTHPGGRLVYVTSEEANLVHVVDVELKEVLANITVGNRPRRFAFSSSRNELWVTNELSGSVSIIDADTNQVIETLEFLPKGFRKTDVTPVGLLFDESAAKAYVALGRANHVAVVDLADREITDYILVGKRAWGMALDTKRARLLVANGLSDDMSVIDTATNKVIKTLPVARVPHSIIISGQQ